MSTTYQRSPYHAPEQRIPTLKTWRQLEQLAADGRLQLLRSFGIVTIATIGRRSKMIATISTRDIDDEDADRVVRAALAGALEVLRGMP